MTEPSDATAPDAPEGAAAPEVDVLTARDRFAAGALLLDVREPEEWVAGHIQGAAHVPLGELDPASYPADREILALCRSGNRSSKAAVQLLAAGRNVFNVSGGMKAWADAGQPVVTDSGAPVS